MKKASGTSSTRFTVIVPTRERADTLRHCLRTLTAQNYDDLRILVSDNRSEDETRAVVASAADPRVSYLKPDVRLSMARHWEFALSHVNDGWVMFIGDDDGLCPDVLSRLDELIRSTSVEAVNSAYSLFVWPGHLSEHPSGKLVIPLGTGATVKNTKTELKRALSGRVPYTKLPWLYNGGAASIRAINAARARDGRFFLSQTPDLYSGIALSLTLDRFLSVESPIVVGGTSRHSTGYSTSLTSSQDEKSAAALYALEENIPFHKDLIFNSSIEMLLYECYLQAAHLHTREVVVSLEEQLQLAVSAALPAHRDKIEEDCRKIAQLSGVRPPRTGGQFAVKLRRMCGDLARIATRLVVDPGRIGVRNVYDAALATSSIHWAATAGPVPKHFVRLFSGPRELMGVLQRRVS